MFLDRGAISKAQHDKSLYDLIEKMGVAITNEDYGAASGDCEIRHRIVN